MMRNNCNFQEKLECEIILVPFTKTCFKKSSSLLLISPIQFLTIFVRCTCVLPFAHLKKIDFYSTALHNLCMWTTFAQTSKRLCIFEGNNTFRSCVRLQAFYYPPDAGLPIGGPGSSRFLRLEVHYHNPLLISGTHTHPSVYCRTSFSFSHAHTSSRILQIYDGVAADVLILIRSHNMHSYFSNFLQIFFLFCFMF